ncbi:hypothetical protein KAU43_07760 [candidate division WOR-3 bacterium]|nr:hypothetical protein [candidate division WOR-3 bacterium]
MGWKGESRRHSLSRKGIKTNLPDGRRFDVSNYVARGKPLSKSLDDIDGMVNNKIHIDNEVEEFQRYKNEWVEFIEKELSKKGFSDDDIDDMQIETWVDGILFDKMVDELSYQAGSPMDDLSQWIEDQTGDKIDTTGIEKEIYDSFPLLDKRFESIVRQRDIIEIDTERELLKLGISQDDIDDMQIETWSSNRLLDELEDEMGWQRLFTRTDTLEEWIKDQVELDKLIVIDSNEWKKVKETNNLTRWKKGSLEASVRWNPVTMKYQAYVTDGSVEVVDFGSFNQKDEDRAIKLIKNYMGAN